MRLFALFTVIFGLISCGGSDNDDSKSISGTCPLENSSLPTEEIKETSGNFSPDRSDKYNLVIDIDSGNITINNDQNIGTICLNGTSVNLEVQPMATVDKIYADFTSGNITVPDSIPSSDINIKASSSNLLQTKTAEIDTDNITQTINEEHALLTISASYATITVNKVDIDYLIVTGTGNDIYFPEPQTDSESYTIGYVETHGDNNIFHHPVGTTFTIDVDTGSGNLTYDDQ